MKRADIEVGTVYGFTEDRAHIYRYSAVMVLSLDSYVRSRYGDRLLTPCSHPRERLNQGGWRTHTDPVGLLAVMIHDASHDGVRRLRALATIEAAVTALNDGTGDFLRITDGTDAQTGQPVVLGRYMLLTDARHLHGDYYELTRVLDEAKRQHNEYAENADRERIANVATFNDLAGRLGKLGITGYHAASYESPTRFEKLRFEDLDTLLDLAEHGMKMRAFDTHKD